MPDCGGDFRLVRHSTSRRRRRRASKINSGGSGGGFASRGHQPTVRPTARPTDSHRLITTVLSGYVVRCRARLLCARHAQVAGKACRRAVFLQQRFTRPS